MKKIISLVLTLTMLLLVASAFASCGSDDNKNSGTPASDASSAGTTSTGNSETTDGDLAYIQNKGKLVVGITEFEPMDYQDENGKWIGFDADAANAFAAYLGVTAEFVLIDWDNKTFELSGKKIDCVWNGMTLTDEVTAAMATSKPYFNNAQVVIVRADVAEQYKTAEDCKNLQFAVEKGSAGQDAAIANGFNYTEVADQATALMEVAAGTSDAAIIDFLMAVASVGEGTDYSSLTYTASLSSEKYGVGFRKGSDLAAKLNQFFAEKAADGTLEQIATTYGIAEYLIKDYAD